MRLHGTILAKLIVDSARSFKFYVHFLVNYPIHAKSTPPPLINVET